MANYTSTNTGANIDSAINQVIDSSTDLNVDSGTLVVDKSENKVGVGTTAPGQQLTVSNATTYSATQGGGLRLQAFDGSNALDSGDRLGFIEFSGAESASAITQGAEIEAICDNNWSAAENGTELRFSITDGNAASSEVLRLAPALTTTNQPIKFVGTDAVTQLQFFDDSTNVFQITQAENASGNKNVFQAGTNLAMSFNTGGANERMSIDKDGQVEIKQTNIGQFQFPTAAAGDSSTDNYTFSFQGVRGSGIDLRHNTDSRNIRIIAGTGGVQLNTGGATSWSAVSSDERLKQNWNIFENATDKINTLTKIGEYQMKDPDTGEFPKGKDSDGSEITLDKKHYGLSAQEIESILPEAVHTNPNGYKGLCYQDVFVLAIKAIQELSAKVTALENG